MSKGSGRSNKLVYGIVAAAVLGLAAFVPVRTCDTCHGIAGFKAGDIDLRCRDCGGKGKQTVLDIVIAAVRK